MFIRASEEAFIIIHNNLVVAIWNSHSAQFSSTVKGDVYELLKNCFINMLTDVHHPSYSTYLGWIGVQAGSQDALLPSHTLQLPLGDPNAFFMPSEIYLY